MAAVNKIDSNVVELRFSEETALKVAGSVWYPLDPNSYSDFGAEITKVARTPINRSRQRKKGMTTDLDASGGFNIDMTQENVQRLLQGFMFADHREKANAAPSAVTSTVYSISSTTGFYAGALLLATGFAIAGNNGLKVAGTVTLNTSVAASGLAAEASPPAASKITVVGFQFTSGDLNVDASGTWPAITSTTKTLTELGLIVGEWVFIGGDSASENFVTDANNGFKRVRSIAANRIEFDKSDLDMVTETGTGLTIRMFIGRVLKNELDTLIKRRTYQLERTLGAPDSASPSQIQSQYLVGSCPNELTFNIPTADKLTIDMTFVALDEETRDGATGVKAGTRPALVEADAFNTSSDFSRIRMAVVNTTGSEAPTPLFAFVTELTLSVNNNVSSDKAVGRLGGFDLTVGTFEVGGDITAYFSSVTALSAIRNNSNVTLDIAMFKNNQGWIADWPLITLGDGRLNVELDKPITIPLQIDAATAASVNAATDYTLLLVFFDYLPNLANIDL